MNEEKLENWWENYKTYPKLSISEVKKLYLQYQQTNDKQIFEEMINGTMYLIYNSLKNYYYTNYNTIDFDIDDVIMDSTLLWLKFLKSGEVLKIEIFSEYLRRNFHNQLINTILKSSFMNISVMNLYGVGYRTMGKLLFMYVHGLINNNVSLELQDILKQLNEVANDINIDLKLVPSRKFEFIIKPLIHLLIKENLNNNIEAKEQYEEIINKVFYEQNENKIRKATKSSIILQSYCGFFSENPKTVKELALEYNCSRQNIEQTINRELERIRKQIN